MIACCTEYSVSVLRYMLLAFQVTGLALQDGWSVGVRHDEAMKDMAQLYLADTDEEDEDGGCLELRKLWKGGLLYLGSSAGEFIHRSGIPACRMSGLLHRSPR